jgi:hypothetical protein
MVYISRKPKILYFMLRIFGDAARLWKEIDVYYAFFIISMSLQLFSKLLSCELV